MPLAVHWVTVTSKKANLATPKPKLLGPKKIVNLVKKEKRRAIVKANITSIVTSAIARSNNSTAAEDAARISNAGAGAGLSLHDA